MISVRGCSLELSEEFTIITSPGLTDTLNLRPVWLQGTGSFTIDLRGAFRSGYRQKFRPGLFTRPDLNNFYV